MIYVQDIIPRVIRPDWVCQSEQREAAQVRRQRTDRDPARACGGPGMVFGVSSLVLFMMSHFLHAVRLADSGSLVPSNSEAASRESECR